MKKIVLLLLFISLLTIGNTQVLTITDIDTDEPLALATLTSEHSKIYATTNTKGQAEITSFKDTETIEIRLVGYQTRFTSYRALAQNNFKIRMKPSNISLDEVVVSASRWNQKSSEVPAKIISLSPKTVSLQNPQTAADMLTITGEVFVQKSQQGGGSPMIRGFATNRLLYTVDGVRMNTAIFRGGNIQNVISLDPYAIEKTEVLFGPGSVIYGSDAIGGVMSFQTLTPQLAITDSEVLISGKADARYSTANNEKTGHFDINIGWKKWASVTSFSTNDYGHLQQGRHGPDEYIKDYYIQRMDTSDRLIRQDNERLQIPSAYQQMNMMQKIRFRPNNNWDFQYGFHYSETSEYGRYDRHNRINDSGAPRYGEWNYGPQVWMMNHLNLTHSVNYYLYDQLTFRLAQQFFEESRLSRAFNDPGRDIRNEKVEAYSANIDLVKSTSSRNTVYYGFEYVFNDITSTGSETNILNGSTVPGPARYPQSEWSSAAIYLNNKLKLNPKWTLQAGMRYNLFTLQANFDTTFYPFPFTDADIQNDALTGSIGGVYRPSDTWVVSLNFGTAFRSPNVDDMGKVFDSEPGAVVVPNPDLKAEYAYNVDMGIAKIIGNHAKLDVTGYYTILNNALVRRDYRLNGQDSILYDGTLSRVQAMRNMAVARVYGIQAGLEISLPAGFMLSSDMNYQVGKEEMSDGTTSPSRHAAPFFGVTRLICQANKLHIQIYTRYQGERSHKELAVEERSKYEIYAYDDNGNTYSPAWYTLNIKARYTLSEVFTISTGIENITDQRYRPYSSGISGAGRNFILAGQVRF
ncbi:MAG: TonB-dependent receptor [Bacteroidetes bacterium]|jgi:hemoglobin/transferrin/lactoferrin receptor protein|nr:TonB-dependent receptor [Bacteroidota bacterium]